MHYKRKMACDLIIDYGTGTTAKYNTICFNLLAKMHSAVQHKVF